MTTALKPPTLSPVVKTTTPNGDLATPPEKRKRYYCYSFTAKTIKVPALRPDVPNPGPFYKSVSEALARTYPNIGDLHLAIAAKLIGVRHVEGYALVYDSEGSGFSLIVTPDRKNWVTLGTIRPESD